LVQQLIYWPLPVPPWRALLTAFGSLAGVRRATREELGAVVGARAAAAVIDYFARS